jgi:hypothetical protein
MKLTNSEILTITGFAKASSSFVNNPAAKLTVKFAWNWRKNLKKLQELTDEINAMRQKIVDEFSDDEHSYANDDGRFVKAEYLEEYASKVDELLSQENEVEISKIKIEDLGNIEISIPEMDAIGFMIEE